MAPTMVCCQQCGDTNFDLLDGLYYCSTCQTQTQEDTEESEEEDTEDRASGHEEREDKGGEETKEGENGEERITEDTENQPERPSKVSRMRMAYTVAFCYLGLLRTNPLCTASDVVRWIRQNKVPFSAITNDLPLDMKFTDRDFSTFCIQAIPSPQMLRHHTSMLSKYLDLPPLPSLPLAPLVHTYITHLKLPGELHGSVNTLLTHLPPTITPPPHTHHIPHPEVTALACIIVTLKLLLGLNDHTETELSKYSLKLKPLLPYDHPQLGENRMAGLIHPFTVLADRWKKRHENRAQNQKNGPSLDSHKPAMCQETGDMGPQSNSENNNATDRVTLVNDQNQSQNRSQNREPVDAIPSHTHHNTFDNFQHNIEFTYDKNSDSAIEQFEQRETNTEHSEMNSKQSHEQQPVSNIHQLDSQIDQSNVDVNQSSLQIDQSNPEIYQSNSQTNDPVTQIDRFQISTLKHISPDINFIKHISKENFKFYVKSIQRFKEIARLTKRQKINRKDRTIYSYRVNLTRSTYNRCFLPSGGYNKRAYRMKRVMSIVERMALVYSDHIDGLNNMQYMDLKSKSYARLVDVCCGMVEVGYGVMDGEVKKLMRLWRLVSNEH